MSTAFGNFDICLLAEKIHLVAVDRFQREVMRLYDVLEIRLSGRYSGGTREYLAGQGMGKYSIADINAWPWMRKFDAWDSRMMNWLDFLIYNSGSILLRRDRLWSEVWGIGTTRMCIQNCYLRHRNSRV